MILLRGASSIYLYILFNYFNCRLYYFVSNHFSSRIIYFNIFSFRPIILNYIILHSLGVYRLLNDLSSFDRCLYNSLSNNRLLVIGLRNNWLSNYFSHNLRLLRNRLCVLYSRLTVIDSLSERGNGFFCTFLGEFGKILGSYQFRNFIRITIFRKFSLYRLFSGL